MCNGGAERVKRVLENLFRITNEHGENDVTIRVGPVDETGCFVEDDRRVNPEDEREAVFEAGVSLAEAGTGFGLVIVKEIVEARGGISMSLGAKTVEPGSKSRVSILSGDTSAPWMDY